MSILFWTHDAWSYTLPEAGVCTVRRPMAFSGEHGFPRKPHQGLKRLSFAFGGCGQCARVHGTPTMSTLKELWDTFRWQAWEVTVHRFLPFRMILLILFFVYILPLISRSGKTMVALAVAEHVILNRPPKPRTHSDGKASTPMVILCPIQPPTHPLSITKSRNGTQGWYKDFVAD